MQIKYYSEILGKYFDEEKELAKAEKDYKLAQEKAKKEIEEAKAKRDVLLKTRGDRAKEVEDAFRKANQLMADFTKDYGSFHFTMTTPFTSINRLLDDIFNF